MSTTTRGTATSGTAPRAAGSSPAGNVGVSASPPRAPAPRARRRPGLMSAGVALIALGVLSGVWLVNRAGERTAVLAMARPVPYGQVLTAGDLTRAQVSVDPTVATVPAADLVAVVGRVAATNLSAGALLSRAELADAAPPAPGEVLVAVALPAPRMPAGSLQAGDRVLIVATPEADADVAAAGAPASIAATVVRLGRADLNGVTVVDVTVPSADGPTLAAWSATGRIALVVQPRAALR